MSIAKRVKEAIDKMSQNDAEAALIPTSIAIDATAKNEYPSINLVGERYRKFIKSNLLIITKITFGGIGFLKGVFVPNIFQKVPGMGKVTSPTVGLEDIFYSVVRCQLLHTAELPLTIKFQGTNTISTQNGTLLLPINFVYGLLFSIIGAASNLSQKQNNYDMNLNFKDGSIPICNLWGKNKLLLDFIENRKSPKEYLKAIQNTDRNDPCPCGSGLKFKKCCL